MVTEISKQGHLHLYTFMYPSHAFTYTVIIIKHTTHTHTPQTLRQAQVGLWCLGCKKSELSAVIWWPSRLLQPRYDGPRYTERESRPRMQLVGSSPCYRRHRLPEGTEGWTPGNRNILKMCGGREQQRLERVPQSRAKEQSLF